MDTLIVHGDRDGGKASDRSERLGVSGKHDKSLDDDKAKKLLLTGPILIRGLGRSVKDAALPGRPSRHRAFVGDVEDVRPTQDRSAPLPPSTSAATPFDPDDVEARKREGRGAAASPLCAATRALRRADLDGREGERAYGNPETDHGPGAEVVGPSEASAASPVDDARSEPAEPLQDRPVADVVVGPGPAAHHGRRISSDWALLEELYRRLVTMPTSDRGDEVEGDGDE